MKVEEFEKHIKHLADSEIVRGSVFALNRILIEKGLVTKEELQDMFLEWLKDYDSGKKKR